jgi:hypothetical protein
VKSVLEFFWQFLLGVTGAVGFAALIVGAATVACGFGLVSCGYGWRRWRRRRATKAVEERE